MQPGVIERVGWWNTVVHLCMHELSGACGVRFESLYDDLFLKDVFFAVGSNPAKGERPHAYFLFKSGIYIYICTSCGNPHKHFPKHLACDWPWGQSQGTAAPRAQQLQHSPALHIPLLTEHGALKAVKIRDLPRGERKGRWGPCHSDPTDHS